MIKIDVRSNIKETVKKLERVAVDQVPFATALALTKTAQVVKTELVKEMTRVFDRPTRYTLNSLYIRSATKKTLTAKVWLKDDTFKGTPAAKYLGPQIFAGERKLKRFEQSLRHGGLLPVGMYAVPGSGAELDSYGNMRRGQITTILSALKASNDPMQNRTKNSVKRNKGQAEYFVGAPGKAPLGIWRRYRFAAGSAVKPIVIFVRKATYRKRLDFFGVAEKTIDRHFSTEFALAAERALATMR